MQDYPDRSRDAPLSLLVLNRLGLGIAVLDLTRSVLFANPRARELFGAADTAVRTAHGRLHFVDRTAERNFQRTLGQIGLAGTAAECVNEIIVLQRSCRARMPLVVSICGLAVEPPAVGPRLLLTFVDAADALSATSVQRVAEFFGLTPAEQRLTQYLASGGCLKGAAREFGVSPHTVRNQLRAVFEKSGVQRQADLTRLFMTGGSANFPAMNLQHKSGREIPRAYH